MGETYFSIRKSKDGQYYFVIVAANGEDLCTSEMYTQKHSCQDGIESACKVFSSNIVVVKEEYGKEKGN
jgi:uncharacterized protein YegP (UPF0339 family)